MKYMTVENLIKELSKPNYQSDRELIMLDIEEIFDKLGGNVNIIEREILFEFEGERPEGRTNE